MKGLSVEEKAKRYNEAIERAKGLIDFCSDSELKTLEHVFPELKESEDERMRNVAINACKYMVDNFENSTKQYEDAIAWLEKQGEQKPAEWSEEDENLFRCAIDAVREESKVRTDGCLDEEVGEMVIDWLKSLRPQNTWKPSDLPHWKKSNLPNDNTTGFNSDYFCYKGYSINYKELFEKLLKDD